MSDIDDALDAAALGQELTLRWVQITNPSREHAMAVMADEQFKRRVAAASLRLLKRILTKRNH